MQEFCAKLVIITIDFSKAVCYNEITKKQYIQKLKKQVFCVKAFSPTSSRVNLPLANSSITILLPQAADWSLYEIQF
jgi:hypothetical protein